MSALLRSAALDDIATALRGDSEFTLASRKLSARVHLVVGVRTIYIAFQDGVLHRFTDASDGYEPYDFRIAAPEVTWKEILRPEPRPFYQDLYSARARHDVEMSGDLDLLFAYYNVFRRMTEVLRTNQGADRA